MCLVLFTWWAGRHNNGAIGPEVRGSAINTRVVELPQYRKSEDQVKRDGVVVGEGKLGGPNGLKDTEGMSHKDNGLSRGMAS
jgi:hypothetical protein